MSKTSTVYKDRIVYPLWLIFDDRGNVRATRSRSGLNRNERAVSLTVTLPTSLFKLPELRASIIVPDGGTEFPPIDINAAADALRAVVGCDIDMRVTGAPESPE